MTHNSTPIKVPFKKYIYYDTLARQKVKTIRHQNVI